MIYLVRHAEYENPSGIIPGRLPVPLSDNGRKQADLLARFFENKNITQIFSSPVRRCRETAETISRNITPIVFDIRLAEVLSAMQGSEDEKWREALYSATNIIGGETPRDIYDRVASFWETTDFQKGKNYIVCSHGDPLYFLFQFLQSQQPFDNLSINEPVGYQQKASVRVIENSKELEYLENHEIEKSLNIIV